VCGQFANGRTETSQNARRRISLTGAPYSSLARCAPLGRNQTTGPVPSVVPVATAAGPGRTRALPGTLGVSLQVTALDIASLLGATLAATCFVADQGPFSPERESRAA
jgi:hypothetical protein